MLLVNTELTPQQRLDKAVTDIMGHKRYIALAGVMMIGTRKTCPNTPTARTNGRDEVYGETMINAITEKNLRYLVLHEVEGHKLHRHLTTWAHLFEIDAECANKAADYYTNLMLNDENKDDGFAVMPTGEYAGLVDEKYRGMDTAQIFNDCMRRRKRRRGRGASQVVSQVRVRVSQVMASQVMASQVMASQVISRKVLTSMTGRMPRK
tara:strand:+ start:1077 stop:1700 length:624 start_codon:yes stop_codon:yes gene_type:complete